MSRARGFISILMALILIALSGASVWAAPNGQDSPDEESISGEVQDIVIEFDEDTETTTVLVTLKDDLGETQKIRLSLEGAIALGLVTEDEDGNLTVNEEMKGKNVVIDPSYVIEEDGDEEDDEETLHPVASALAKFFADTLGLDYDTVMGYHEDGMGFGVIAQACWMSFALKGDAALFGDILEAKKEHDFSSIELPSGETPKNWGQFKKAVLNSDKAQKNLGAIMSGRAKIAAPEPTDTSAETATTANQGKGKKGKGPGEESGGPPAESPGKGKGKGGGKPDTPPGQDKGGGKDKGGSKGKGK